MKQTGVSYVASQVRTSHETCHISINIKHSHTVNNIMVFKIHVPQYFGLASTA